MLGEVKKVSSKLLGPPRKIPPPPLLPSSPLCAPQPHPPPASRLLFHRLSFSVRGLVMFPQVVRKRKRGRTGERQKEGYSKTPPPHSPIFALFHVIPGRQEPCYWDRASGASLARWEVNWRPGITRQQPSDFSPLTVTVPGMEYERVPPPKGSVPEELVLNVCVGQTLLRNLVCQ
ncbi:unnamed protein product [Pleuronectes platessa]|uniref:Uncharacterized protein n=1 Tax=Pleuronectes platessa TaxID=8262 RepID=A0A9N7VK18_PLEPL|nr:unnamed protein product [Pleuronectes platessa]